MTFSFIIPTHNRKDLVCKSIDSALKFIDQNTNYDIIIIDDNSEDGSYEIIKDKYKIQIQNNLIKLLKLKKNMGVVAARNYGARESKSNWLIFLDSDNEIISDNKKIFEEIIQNTKSVLVMFRCIDENNKLIGPINLLSRLSYRYALNNEFCETLGVCKRLSYLEEYEKKDVIKLRRFESIAFYRLLKKHSEFEVSNIIMRKYSFDSPNRLSSRNGAIKDANLIMKGHCILLKDHFFHLTFKKMIRTFLAIIYYFFISIKNKSNFNFLKS